MGDSELPLETKLREALSLGREFLDAENGHIERIVDSDSHEIVASVGDDSLFAAGERVDRSSTYCRKTLTEDSPLAISDALDEGFGNDPAYREHSITCYLGATVSVGGDAYGTVCFVSRQSRPDEFSSSERSFTELIAQLLGRELELHRHKRTQEQLARTEQVTAVGGWELDVDTETLTWTDGTRQIHGVGPDYEPTLENALEFYHTDDREKLTQAISRCRETGEPYNIELRLITASGEERWVQTMGERVTEEGSVKLHGAIQEITDRKVREQRLKVLHRVLRHNLRNQLNVVLGYTETLEEELAALPSLPETGDPDSEKHRQQTQRRAQSQLNRIEETATDLVALAEKSRQFDRIDTYEKVSGSVRVRPILESLQTEFEEAYPDATIDIEGDDTAVRGNQEAICSVLEELLENALEHDDQDAPSVQLSLESHPSERVAISVVDTGPGMPEAEQTVLARGEETPLMHGSGLGLWLVNWLVVRLGGSLSIRDNDPRGTIVTIVLPKSSAGK